MNLSSNKGVDVSKRDFLRKVGVSAILPGSLLEYPYGFRESEKEHNSMLTFEREDYQLYVKLLTSWCGKLLSLQIKDSKHKGLQGGILCPSCGRIHGRVGETMLPFMWMAQYTGDKKYVEAAKNVMNWAESNVSLPNGSWVNDVNVNLWNGITVFGSIALGETLKNHGHLLEPEIREKWMFRLQKACDFLYDFMTVDTSNINYPLCSTYAFALGGTILNNQKFLERGKYFASFALDYFTKPSHLIFGECKPRTASPKGCLPIDLAYNVEETLPNLTNYALLTEDKTLLSAVVESWKSHVEFMLPDGTWDDSFGTRNHKWTMWGSRNSDGNQAALTLLSKHSSVFAEAAYRNALLLEKCTFDGILYGGPHYKSHDVEPCIHHGFAHAKSLADALNHPDSFRGKFERAPLPRDESYGVKRYTEADTWLIAQGHWRATVTGNDCEYPESPHASGGSLSMLYHLKMGLILTDSLGEWKLREAANMQMNTDPVCMTFIPRVEMMINKMVYSSSRYLKAVIREIKSEGNVCIEAETALVNFDLKAPSSGTIACKLKYVFEDNEVLITVKLGLHSTRYDKLSFILPVVSEQKESVLFTSGNSLEIEKLSGKLKIHSNASIAIQETGTKRLFSYSPGVEAIPVSINWDTEKFAELEIKLTYLELS